MRFLLLIFFMPIILFGEVKILNPLPFKLGEHFSFKIFILGQYVGLFHMQLPTNTNINDVVYPITFSQLFTRPELRSLYDMFDSDKTIFDHTTLLPVYHERTIKEGAWEDHLRLTFSHSEKACFYYSKKRDYKELKLVGKNPIMDYNTLLLYFRSLDYNSIDLKENIYVSYRHRENVYNSYFNYERVVVTYKKQKVKAILVKENGGLGIYFTMLDDENRTPFEIRIGAFYIVGFRFVDLYVLLENFYPGSELIQ